MNSLTLAIIVLILFALGYRFYARWLEKLWEVDPKKKTPAYECYDGTDYVPAKSWFVLFGHHYASIAGAGPIIGPVIAGALWGWLPAIIWIVVGTIIIGAVHDFCTLMVSLRHKGRSIAEVSARIMSPRARLLFASFLWLALILVIAVFASAAAKTFTVAPQVVIPTIGLIPIALFVGLIMYRWHVNITLSTIIGLLMLFGLIVLGFYLPVKIGEGEGVFRFWVAILICYAFFASITPVNLLLQPRDYLAAFVLFLGLACGFIGLVIMHPDMHAPAFTNFWGTQKQAGELKWLWPMMFVTVACGAVSGFHSLIASGTTSKQLPSEKYARRIGYGSMVLEGVLALLAIVAVCGGVAWADYRKMIAAGEWIPAFGKGFGFLTSPLLSEIGIAIGVKTLAVVVGIIIVKTFIMTTLDSATRIARYIGEELFCEGLGIKAFRSRIFNTAIITCGALFLALGPWKLIWPVFGASNQLVAAMALLVISLYLLSRGRTLVFTRFPAVFMLFTTVGALACQACGFFADIKTVYLGIIAVVLIILALFLFVEAIISYRRIKRTIKR